MPDELTTRWCRNAADERAAANGCRFDLDRACWAVWWMERFCRLYEGEWAGDNIVMRGAFSMPIAPILNAWDEDGRELSLQRARDYMDCVDAGERCDWQYEVAMRVFGWVRPSLRWQREVRRFNRGGVWVPKKNKKSPTMAAVALYLLAGDGEKGQKVFLGAKDSTQIRKNVSLHILEMVRQSPELAAECKINLTDMSVVHLPTMSLLMPLSSSNSRTQESKEGLNGSLLIDETHVVDRDFIKRVDRMGISRSEPLFLQFSTAGKDPDSYGKEEFDRGVEVNAGRKIDDAYFFAYYGADQTVTDEALARDPAAIIAAANPALGHTVELDEALADYERSKDRIMDLADFKTYRLNIWQRSANPWLKANDWLKCGRVYTPESLFGQVCGAGLDLGKTDDMSAFSLVFPEDVKAWAEAASAALTALAKPEGVAKEEKEQLIAALQQPVKALTWYWLPEASLEKYDTEGLLAEWVRAGHLKLTNKNSNNTVDPDEILEDMRKILGQYQVKMFAYDPWYAAPVVGALKKYDGFPEEFCWPFAQTPGSYAWVSALFERLVIAGMLHHDGNPITAWEAGHVQAKEDGAGNVRPVKPKRQDGKKIDGIVSMIMGLDATTRIESLYSVYEERGVLML